MRWLSFQTNASIALQQQLSFLYDEKRQSIQIGDQIRLPILKDGYKSLCEVVQLHVFKLCRSMQPL